MIIKWDRFREIADSVGAYLLADMSHVSGLVAAGIYPSPVPYADVVTTTTHKTLVGPRGGLILAKDNEDIHKKLNSALFPGSQGGPLMHVIAAKAVCFKEAMEPEFKEYQNQVLKNAQYLSKKIMEKGIDIVSNGKDLTGKEVDNALGKANITVNKNSVPNDPKSPFVTSGIRIGTPAVTRRGFKEDEMDILSDWISNIILDVKNDNLIESTKSEVKDLCAAFPDYESSKINP